VNPPKSNAFPEIGEYWKVNGKTVEETELSLEQ
jgi:hypothetical protein